MLNFRKIALMATLAGTMALPALAQTPVPASAPVTAPVTDPAPAATQAAPLPDTGVKQTTVAPKPMHKLHKHVHKASLRHHMRKPTTVPAEAPAPETTTTAPQNQ